MRGAITAALCCVVWASQLAAQLRTRNVVLIMPDGLRWQEVFFGADSLLMSRQSGGVADTARLRRDLWRGTAEERRATLLPFFWSRVAREGQLYGNRIAGSSAQVTNGLKFSYPGYNEALTGRADPRIDRNDFGPNPNITVFEWLNGLPAHRGRVAAFANWNVFAEIFNRKRSGVSVHAGWELPFPSPADSAQALLNRLFETTSHMFEAGPWDSFEHAVVRDYLRRERPRVLFIGYGETDEWAHSGRYDLYLRAAQRVDWFIAELWETMQALPEYRGATTFIVTTDHGRGEGAKGWRDHGKDVDGAENIWIAVIGPDTPPLGERKHAGPVTQSQIAATIAALLGEDFRGAFPGAAPPLVEVVGRR